MNSVSGSVGCLGGEIGSNLCSPLFGGILLSVEGDREAGWWLRVGRNQGGNTVERIMMVKAGGSEGDATARVIGGIGYLDMDQVHVGNKGEGLLEFSPD